MFACVQPLKIKIAELSAECSKIWKTVSPEDKKYWEGVSNKDKEEYLKKKDDYKGPWRVVKDKKKVRRTRNCLQYSTLRNYRG